MSYDFNTSLKYSRDHFASLAATIDTNLAVVDQRIVETQRAAAALSDAIAASPLLVAGVLTPGAEKATIDTYKSTATSASAQLATLRASDAATYASAQNVISQGRSIWNTVKTNHSCT